MGRLFLLGRGQQRMLSPRIPTVWFRSELPLLLPAQLSSVLLEPENNTGRKGAPSSTVAARSSSSAVQTCSPPATPPARSHRCWELLTRKQDQCWMAQGVCLLLQEWEQLSSVKSDKLHWTIGGAPAPEKVCACVHSCSPNLSWGRELGWTEVALPGAGPARAHGGKNHRS